MPPTKEILKKILVVLLATIAFVTSDVSRTDSTFGESPLEKNRKRKEREEEECLFLRNTRPQFDRPEHPLEAQHLLAHFLIDENR